MNQNLNLVAIQALRQDLSQLGYTGSIEELKKSVQKASTMHEESRFWLMLGFDGAVDPSNDNHPLRAWLAMLMRHFDDVTFRPGDSVGGGAAIFGKRKHLSAGSRRPTVFSVVVTVQPVHSASRLEVSARYFDAEAMGFRRSQTFFVRSPRLP